jgi:hypothetical protein
MPKFFRFCFVLGQSILQDSKKKIEKLDNERLAIGFISIIGIGLLVPLLVIAPALFESEWFLNLVTIPAEYGSFIAGGAYLGRLWNLFTARPYAEGKKTKVRTLFNQEVIINRQIGYAEKLFTPVGMCLGVSLGIFCISLHAVIPFLGVFSYFAYILFILSYACALGGLFNRLASSFDGTRLAEEKTAIFIGVVVGLLLAISLFTLLILTGTMPFVVVIGISKPFIDLLALHKFLFALPFVLSLTSLTTSFFDYFAKAYCFLKYKGGTEDELLNECIQSRNVEYLGAFLGISLGCLLALGITTGLVATGSLIATPIVITATIFVTILICNNVLAALFSRIGRFIDGVKRLYTTLKFLEINKEIKSDELISSHNIFSLVVPSKYSTKDPNDNEIKTLYKLKRVHSSPAFFTFYADEKALADNKTFCSPILSAPSLMLSI